MIDGRLRELLHTILPRAGEIEFTRHYAPYSCLRISFKKRGLSIFRNYVGVHINFIYPHKNGCQGIKSYLIPWASCYYSKYRKCKQCRMCKSLT